MCVSIVYFFCVHVCVRGLSKKLLFLLPSFQKHFQE